MEPSAALVAFVGVSSLDRAAEFYGDSLGLDLADERPFAVVARIQGTLLRITEVPSVVPAPYTVLGFVVADIAAAVERLAGRGVAFTRYDGMTQDERGIWTAPSGARIAWFTDPDGNVLSLTQLP